MISHTYHVSIINYYCLCSRYICRHHLTHIITLSINQSPVIISCCYHEYCCVLAHAITHIYISLNQSPHQLLLVVLTSRFPPTYLTINSYGLAHAITDTHIHHSINQSPHHQLHTHDLLRFPFLNTFAPQILRVSQKLKIGR